MLARGQHVMLCVAAALLLLTTTTAQGPAAAITVDGVAPLNFKGTKCYNTIYGCDYCSRYMFPKDNGITYGEGAKSVMGGKYWKISSCQVCQDGWTMYGDGDFYKFKKYPKYCLPPDVCKVSPDPDQAPYNAGFLSCKTDVGAKCSAQCLPGYVGGYNATCTQSSKGPIWVVEGKCTKVPAGKQCPPTPPKKPYGKPFENCDTYITAECMAGCEPPNIGKGYTAKCKLIGKKARWVVDGACAPPINVPDCSGPPDDSKAPYSKGFKDCKKTEGSSCKADCSDGYFGLVTATCTYSPETQMSDWVYVGTCTKVPPINITCPAAPPAPTDPNFDKYINCTDLVISKACVGTCKPNYIGGFAAICLNGTWLVEGACISIGGGTGTCSSTPPKQPPNTVPVFGTGCISGGAIGTACFYRCVVGLGGYVSVCTKLAGPALPDWIGPIGSCNLFG